MKTLNIICFFIFVQLALSDPLPINYKDISDKELVQTKLERLYFLNLLKTTKTEINLTGRNLIDYNGFNNINTIKTYTTLQINF
jgi:hypothetical protein